MKATKFHVMLASILMGFVLLYPVASTAKVSQDPIDIGKPKMLMY